MTYAKQGFGINDSKGFRITFANGWTVSVQFGPGNYCDNYDMPIGRDGSLEAGKRGSSTAEIAAWDANNKWFERPIDGGYTDTVFPRQTPAQVLGFMNLISRMSPVAKPETP